MNRLSKSDLTALSELSIGGGKENTQNYEGKLLINQNRSTREEN